MCTKERCHIYNICYSNEEINKKNYTRNFTLILKFKRWKEKYRYTIWIYIDCIIDLKKRTKLSYGLIYSLTNKKDSFGRIFW